MRLSLLARWISDGGLKEGKVQQIRGGGVHLPAERVRFRADIRLSADDTGAFSPAASGESAGGQALQDSCVLPQRAHDTELPHHGAWNLPAHRCGGVPCGYAFRRGRLSRAVGTNQPVPDPVAELLFRAVHGLHVVHRREDKPPGGEAGEGCAELLRRAFRR